MQNEQSRPRYNMWQNTWYMIRQAWTVPKPVLFLCIATVMISVGLNLTELFVVPTILKKVEETVSLSELVQLILLFSGILLLLSGLNAYVNQNTLCGRVAVRMSLIQLVSKKVMTTSYPNINDPVFLQKEEKALNNLGGNHQATEAIWKTLTDLATNCSCFVIYLCLLSTLHWGLFLVVIVTAAAGYLATNRANKLAYLQRDEEEAYDKKLSHLRAVGESVDYAKDIRIFGMRFWLDNLYQDTMQLYKAFLYRKERKFILAALINVLLTFLQNGAAYFYLIYITLKSDLPASTFLLYFSAISSFSAWVTGILNTASTLHAQSLDISMVREFCEYPEPFLFDEGKSLSRDPQDRYQLELRNVSFRYPGSEKDIIHNMNLVIHPGEKLAIVGLNGAGKTTLVKLLCGYLDPTEGTVLLNGKDIRQYDRTDCYSLFSAVFQQFSILDISIADNVSQTINTPDMPRLKNCIEKAGLTEKVEQLSQKYHTPLGRSVHENGVELSGGETQRLMLARALYKNAPIIILDEPTAALDPIAENDIYLKYNEMTEGKTALFISHRLASTRFCDRILLLENGMILEEGTHDSLLQENGKYAELFRIQSKYYREGEITE